MIAYKGFDKDLKCRGHQYEVGKTYEEHEAQLCQKGFHSCERPLDVLNYYPPADSRYCVVELDDVSGDRQSDDSKVCAKKIKIGAEIGIPGLVEAQIEYVKEHTTSEHTDPKMATAGGYGAATAGYGGAATAGDSGAATARGTSAVGKNGIASARGTFAKVRGGIGAILICAVECENNYDIETWAAGVVDGDNIKPDTWYTVKDGKFVEASEGCENNA